MLQVLHCEYVVIPATHFKESIMSSLIPVILQTVTNRYAKILGDLSFIKSHLKPKTLEFQLISNVVLTAKSQIENNLVKLENNSINEADSVELLIGILEDLFVLKGTLLAVLAEKMPRSEYIPFIIEMESRDNG